MPPWATTPGYKTFDGGTHRVVPPQVTLERLVGLLPRFGITRVANITGLDDVGVPVALACRPNSRSLAVSQGKGLTLEAAKVSAIMEAVEAWHAERITRPIVLARRADLAGRSNVVDHERLPQLSVSRFDDHLRIPWIEGHDIASDRDVWVPLELVHLDMTLPLPEGSGCFPISSNGLASGNHPLEAAVHAVCEVIERDAYALWHHSDPTRHGTTRVDLASVDSAICRTVVDRFVDAGLHVAVWDITSDVEVAAFRCAIIDVRTDGLRPLYPSSGLGCHPSREIALFRALTEAAQSRLTRIAGSRDDVPRSDYELTRNPDELERIRRLLMSEVAVCSYADAPSFSATTLADDLDELVSRLGRADLTAVILVDLTDPDLDVAVVRAIVPGLEPKPGGPGHVPGARLTRLAADAR